MSLIKRMRRQSAVYWRRGETPDRFGRYSYDNPVEIPCRWADVKEQFVGLKGELQDSKSLVYVDRIIVPGDRLKLGVLESDTSADPLEVTGSQEVRQFEQIPNFRATEFLYVAYL